MRIVLSILFFMAYMPNVCCQAGNPSGRKTGMSDSRLQVIDQNMQSVVDKKQFAGMITLVSRNGVIARQHAYGFSNTEHGTAMSTDDILPIASMTKLVSTIALLTLYEKGYFRLGDPVEKFIPGFAGLTVIADNKGSLTDLQTKPLQRKITIKDLLSHTAGLSYGTSKTVVDSLYRKAGFQHWNKTLRQFIDELVQIPLASQPGENWIYSYSHDVIGYLIETISGMPLEDYCKKNIFDPLGMVDTDFYIPPGKKNRFPVLYIYANGNLQPEPPSVQSAYLTRPVAVSAGGGWSDAYSGVCTTVQDFHRLCSMVLNYGVYNNHRILSRKTIELMISDQTRYVKNRRPNDGYGLGVGITSDAKGSGELGSDGEIYWAGGPYNSFFWIDFREKLIGILFTNTAPFGHMNLMQRFKILANQAIDN